MWQSIYTVACYCGGDPNIFVIPFKRHYIPLSFYKLVWGRIELRVIIHEIIGNTIYVAKE